MEWGARSQGERTVLREIRDEGIRAIQGGESPPQKYEALPDWVRDEEEPYPQWRWLWDGYWAMEGDRILGMGGIRPTPFTAIDRWAGRMGLSPREYGEAEVLIRAMDDEYLSFQREQREREERKRKAKRGGKGNL